MKTKKLKATFLVVVLMLFIALASFAVAACIPIRDWSEWETTTHATCTTHGEQTRTCQTSEITQFRSTPINPSNHDWSSWKTAAVISTRTCYLCYYTQTQWVSGEPIIGIFSFDSPDMMQYTITLNPDNQFTFMVMGENRLGQYTIEGESLILNFLDANPQTIVATLNKHAFILSYRDTQMKFWLVKTFTVSFNSSGGTAIQPAAVQNGRPVMRPADPTLEYHVFVNWYTCADFISPFIFDTQSVTSDITLFAKFIAAPTYHRITFDIGSGTPFHYSYIQDGAFAVPPTDDPDDMIDPIAVMLVIDRSGSMEFYRCPTTLRTFMEIARDAAIMVVNALRPQDFVGVVSFAHDARLDIGLTPVRERTRIINAIQRIDTRGGTIYTDAIRLAGQQLYAETRAERKHIIFFTDGEPNDGFGFGSPLIHQDSGLLMYEHYIVYYYQTHGITLSVLGMVGDESVLEGGITSTETMQRMTYLGGGRYYFIEDVLTMSYIAQGELEDVLKSVSRKFLHWTKADEYGDPIDTDVPFDFDNFEIIQSLTLIAVWSVLD